MILVALALAGCASSAAWVSVPENLAEDAKLPGFERNIRFWGDRQPPNLEQMVKVQIKQAQDYKNKYGGDSTFRMVALSGGGSSGAFGAGLLNGWTKSGTRPEFDIVTGVSTGALVAPFAFLGSKYDRQLKEVFTTISTKDVLTDSLISGLLGGTAIADSKPLYNLISKYITPDFIEQVAREHRTGRRFFVGTTNFEAERPVIWNMGIIANSKNPEKIELFRKILLASASIPGVFPPVTINVTVAGEGFQEVHVDGGTISQVFLYPIEVDQKVLAERLSLRESREMYIILNGQVAPDYKQIRPRTLDIANRAIDTLIKAQTSGDVAQLYQLAQRDDNAFNLAYIPSDFKNEPTEDFDNAYMNALYDIGYNLARKGYRWRKTPPPRL